MSNNFVGMDCCVYCKQPKAIIISRDFKPIPKYSSSSLEPCDACKKKFEENNKVPLHEAEIVSGVPVPTGRHIFIKRDAVSNDPELMNTMNKCGYLFATVLEFQSLLIAIETSRKEIK